MNLRYTRQARADLRNPMRLNPKIVKLCAVLKTHPEIGGQLSNRTGWTTDLYYVIAGKYSIFYKYDHDTVTIIRILTNEEKYIVYGIVWIGCFCVCGGSSSTTSD